mgnify:CR=1 FL=1
MKHHYESLNLEEGDSLEAIQSAYERLSKELDPATNDNQDFFVEEYAKVQEAYKALSQSSILKNNDSSKRSITSNRDEFSSSSNSSDSFTVTISKEKIEELKNRKLDTQQIQTSVPDGLKILSVLSMIGSGLISIIYFVLIFNGFSAVLSVFFIIITVPFVFKFIGALRMYKAKKNGFLIYMIPSIIINIFFFISLFSETQTQPISILFLTIVMIVFSVIFNNYKKHLK